MSVTPTEINDLIIRVRDLRTHLESNKRHLHLIEGRLEAVMVRLMALDTRLGVDVLEEAES